MIYFIYLNTYKESAYENKKSIYSNYFQNNDHCFNDYLFTFYSHQNVKVFKAISTTEALQTSVPVTSSKKIHLYNTHQGEEYVGYNVKEGASYLKDCLTKEALFL